MADKLVQLLRMSRCYMLNQDHQVLDMTKRGTWAALCQHILGLPATRGQVDPAATLVFCDRELELGNPLLWGACNKRIVSTCLQPHLDEQYEQTLPNWLGQVTTRRLWRYSLCSNLHMYVCRCQGLFKDHLEREHWKQDVRVWVGGGWVWLHDYVIHRAPACVFPPQRFIAIAPRIEAAAVSAVAAPQPAEAAQSPAADAAKAAPESEPETKAVAAAPQPAATQQVAEATVPQVRRATRADVIELTRKEKSALKQELSRATSRSATAARTATGLTTSEIETMVEARKVVDGIEYTLEDVCKDADKGRTSGVKSGTRTYLLRISKDWDEVPQSDPKRFKPNPQ